MEDVLGVLPFGNQIWLVSMKGKHIRDTLEYSVQGYSTVNMKGKFLQLTGQSQEMLYNTQTIYRLYQFSSCPAKSKHVQTAGSACGIQLDSGRWSILGIYFNILTLKALN